MDTTEYSMKVKQTMERCKTGPSWTPWWMGKTLIWNENSVEEDEKTKTKKEFGRFLIKSSQAPPVGYSGATRKSLRQFTKSSAGS